MAIWLVTYDLRDEPDSSDYKPLIDELKKQNGHAVLYSVWLVNLDNTAKGVHDHFKGFMDDDDGLVVCEFTKANHYSKAKKGTNDWLKKNLPSR